MMQKGLEKGGKSAFYHVSLTKIQEEKKLSYIIRKEFANDRETKEERLAGRSSFVLQSFIFWICRDFFS
jgi:hypothetical protein